MKTAKTNRGDSDEMRKEYDFSTGVRGKYAAKFVQGAVVVVLADDVAEVFRTARQVNAALRREIRRRPGSKAARQR
jgi:hypothetical protein